jgi:putative protease
MAKVSSNKIGEVTHWYDKIGVAVIKLSKPLSVGDKIKIKHGEIEFEETVNSMQFEHSDIKSAKKGQEIAIKLSQKVREGSVVEKA